jgi:Uma2 family endonuclease
LTGAEIIDGVVMRPSFTTAGVGAPDWIVEVLSPTTVCHDQIKREAYERVGVKEYWEIDAAGQLV